MKKSINLLLTLICMILLSSCEVIGGIFKAGMGFGIFIVVAIGLGLLLLFFKMGKK